ncbi:hypothetical protein CONPUDRAFT_78272 [Coniophora puteana RWD-64-598 SS2]|uniref:Uncharacterized protein n=1 Tax=Coniophora puteana (strain RWD-64-598) TaxID=741705 RepID=R7SE27_CONPW|nr:uncharacterized protein CONPUDRAFT_78272 [Coniophora puteana RWD-64-598 SS2]EIW74115.1 hypothetical protein CONPUDRAFT_78272 [Coniophora puteana RWD-64-598 SS2]
MTTLEEMRGAARKGTGLGSARSAPSTSKHKAGEDRRAFHFTRGPSINDVRVCHNVHALQELTTTRDADAADMEEWKVRVVSMAAYRGPSQDNGVCVMVSGDGSEVLSIPGRVSTQKKGGTTGKGGLTGKERGELGAWVKRWWSGRSHPSKYIAQAKASKGLDVYAKVVQHL